MYAEMEGERLTYIKSHQSELNVSSYIYLRDGINNDVVIGEIVQSVILPSSFVGSPRYMHEITQDAMIGVHICL